MVLGLAMRIAVLATVFIVLSDHSSALALAQTSTQGTPVGLPDLSVRLISSPDPVNFGEILTYNGIVRNQGASRPARPVRLQMTIPSGAMFVAALAPCNREGPVVACTVQPLDPMGSATYAFSVQLTTTSGQVFSLATLDEENQVEDSDRSNNIASLMTTVRVATPTPSATVFPPFLPTRTPTISITPTSTPTRTPGMSGGPELPPRPPAGEPGGEGAPGSAPAPVLVGPPAAGEQPPTSPVELPTAAEPPTSFGPGTPAAPRLTNVPGVPSVPGLPAAVAPQVFLTVLSPTPAYSVTMDLMWTAEPGERYVVWIEEGDWALALWEGEVSAGMVNGWVWIALDSAVERQIVDRAASM